MTGDPVPSGVSAEKQLDTLHDHYKETFALVRDREKQRDRAFFWVIILYALLIFEIQYPASFRGTLGTVSLAGNQLQVSRLPLSGLLDASWVLLFAVAMTYCRVAINIQRQYGYLHRLEEWLSNALLTPELYRREGKVYLEGYPLFLDWTWICYFLLFPAVLLIATIALLVVEWDGLPYALLHKLFDSAVALSVMTSFVLYRFVPMVVEQFRQRRKP